MSYVSTHQSVRQLELVEVDGIRLWVGGTCMKPSTGGRFFENSIPKAPCMAAADIGTGSGYIAIGMANSGAQRVYATDISEDALSIARQNARLNKVDDRVEFRQGDLFAGANEIFDRVVANLPNERLPDQFIGHPDYTHIDGGPSGCELVLKLLAQAPAYLRDRDSTLYITQHSLTDERLLQEVIEKQYRCKVIAERWIPVKPFVTENFVFYSKMVEAKLFDIRHVNGEYHNRVRVLELRVK